jgi:hypothetical protein
LYYRIFPFIAQRDEFPGGLRLAAMYYRISFLRASRYFAAPERALYQGTTSVVPQQYPSLLGFSPESSRR